MEISPELEWDIDTKKSIMLQVNMITC